MGRTARQRVLLVGGALAALATNPVAFATDVQLQGAAGAPMSTAIAAERAASGGSPDAVQTAYNRARDFQEAVRAAGTGSPSCQGLARALTALASTLVDEQEAFDRPDSAARSAAASAMSSRSAAVTRSAGTCRPSSTGLGTPVVVSMQPASGEVFYSNVVASVPTGAMQVKVVVNGRPWKNLPVFGATVRIPTSGRPQRYNWLLTFTDGSGATVGTASAEHTWYLPPSAKQAVSGRRESAAASARLASAVRGFNGTAGVWVQDLTTGQYAGANAGAKFPAASLVKLGLLAGAAARLGQNPQKSPYFYDLQQIAGWSSNLAANRVVGGLGSGCGTSSDALANDGLRRLGAKSSTFTGCYIAGTELQPGLPDAPATSSPALDTSRYTTAQDLGRMMFALQASAVGKPGARSDTGLSAKQGRLILGLLLSSQQRFENRSLFAGGLPGNTPLAQKNGWLRSARGSAGVGFTSSGPVIMAVLMQASSGVSRSSAQTLGAQVARVATSLGSN